MLTLDLPLETYRWHFAPALSLRLAMKFGDVSAYWGMAGRTSCTFAFAKGARLLDGSEFV